MRIFIVLSLLLLAGCNALNQNPNVANFMPLTCPQLTAQCNGNPTATPPVAASQAACTEVGLLEGICNGTIAVGPMIPADYENLVCNIEQCRTQSGAKMKLISPKAARD